MRNKPVDYRTPLGLQFHSQDYHKLYAYEFRSGEVRNWFGKGELVLFVEAYGQTFEYPYPADSKGRLEVFLTASDTISSLRIAKEQEKSPVRAFETALDSFHERREIARETPEEDVKRLMHGLYEYCTENGVDFQECIDDLYRYPSR